MSNTAETIPLVSLRRFSDRTFPRSETERGAAAEYLLCLPLCRGNVRIDSDGGTVFDGDVKPGMLRVTAPGEVFHVERRSPAEAVLISIPASLFRGIAAEQQYRSEPSALSFVEPIRQPLPQVERLTSTLLGLAEIDPGQRQLFLHGIATALLALVFSPRLHPESVRGPIGLSDGEFARCIDFADAHIDARLDLATWATALDLQPGDFVRRFRSTAQMAPYTWLLNWRIDRAKQLLEASDLSLVQVALQVGFSSQSHFTAAFRKRAGTSPGQWRPQARQGA